MSSEKMVKGFLVSKTDTKGKITYCNDAFVEISGFCPSELMGKPHSIVRHPDMPRAVFAYLWEHITKGQEVNVYVKNLAKNGDFYWVFANVTPSFDNSGNIIGYYSVRREPSREGVQKASELYALMCQAESSGGIKAGAQVFSDFFKNLGVCYDNFVMRLQVGEQNIEQKCK